MAHKKKDSEYSACIIKQHSSKASYVYNGKKYLFSIITLKKFGSGKSHRVEDVFGKFVECKVLLADVTNPDHYEHLAIRERIPIYHHEENITHRPYSDPEGKSINHSANYHRDIKRKVEEFPLEFIGCIEDMVKKECPWA